MKHKTSKLLSILLALVMVAGLVPMTVNAAGDVDFSISPNPITFESKVVGYSNIGAAKSFTITNTGTDAINLAGADSSSFEIIGSFTGDYVNPGESKTYTLQHKHGLGKGTYNETITILGKSQADFNKSVTKELSLSFTVLGNEPNFTTTPNPITFETKTVGYGNDWQTITLKNTGEVTLNYSAVSPTYFRVNGLAGRYATPGNDITFDVAPELNLPVGNYNETLKITGTDQNNSLNKIEKEIQLSFTVTSSSTTTNMSADFTNVDFGTIEAGFTNEQAKTQLVRFTNTGTSTITLSNTNPTAQGPFSTYWYNNILQIAPGGYIEVNLKTDETSSFANTAGIYNGTYVFTATNISDSMDTFTISIPAKVVVTDSTPTEHTITVVDGSPSKTSAAKNEPITITADAAPSGKEFDKWVIEEGTITLADANSSTTTFTMPDEDVKVKATYKDIAVTPTAPTITTSTLPGGKVGTAYDQTLAATGDAPISWTIDSGNLPTDLTLGTDGKISGTPTTAGDYTFTVKASNTAGDATKSFTVTIAPADATTYTVSFDGNGGGGTMEDVTNVPAGSYTLPDCGFTAPTNKEFDKWEVSGTKYDEGDSITISGNTTVTALWKDKSTGFFNVSLDPNNIVFTTSEIDYIKWDLLKTISVKILSADTSAKYDSSSLVNFETNGEDSFSDVGGYSSFNVLPVGDLTEGIYTETLNLEVWQTSNPSNKTTIPISLSFTVTGSATTTYTVSFDGNGGGGTMEDVTNVPAGSYTLPDCGFTAPTNKEFDKWEVSGTKYDEGDSITISGNTTVKALWKDKAVTPTTYPVTVNAGTGGTASASPTSAATGTPVNITATPNSGYEVNKITYTPEGESAKDITSSRSFTMPAKKVTVNVSFKSTGGGGGGGGYTTQYTLTYNTNGGSAVASTKHNSGTTVNLTATPTKEGFTFDGWYSDAALTSKITSIKMDGNKTVYAGWKETGSGHDCPSKHLKDVDITQWYHEGVDYVVAKKLMQGIAADLFAPNATTTRAMIVTILYRLEGEPAVSGKSGFEDVEADTWYTNAVAWAEANDIVNGYDTKTFGPMDPITREQMAAIMFRYSKFKGYDTSKTADLSVFTDSGAVSDWAVPAMKWAVAEELFKGVGDNLISPTTSATRAQVATILKRFIENVK